VACGDRRVTVAEDVSGGVQPLAVSDQGAHRATKRVRAGPDQRRARDHARAAWCACCSATTNLLRRGRRPAAARAASLWLDVGSTSPRRRSATQCCEPLRSWSSADGAARQRTPGRWRRRGGARQGWRPPARKGCRRAGRGRPTPRPAPPRSASPCQAAQAPHRAGRRTPGATQQPATIVASRSVVMGTRQLKQVASVLDREGAHCTPSPRCSPDLPHRIARQGAVTHRHREYLREHAAGNSGGAATEVHLRQCLIDYTRPGFGQPQTTEARIDDPRQRGLVPSQGLQRHHADVLTAPFPARRGPGRRSLSLLPTAPHPVLPQLLHGHVRLGSTKAQRAPPRQSLLQRHLGLATPRSARLDRDVAVRRGREPTPRPAISPRHRW